ncbi:MAG: insulinase family protein [Muribaculaceae bacterium]|nr:insulinase family protein [Muribaculaceae bacterium]
MKAILSAFFAAAALSLSAANPIPPDPSVRIGTLENGLTYYIRQNAIPAGQTDFFLAQRVGSVNELDNQQGLAHFLEHMCFNGTEHFPGNSLIGYLEGLGVKFGANLNAYTGTDETVYNICQVPSARQSALDSCVMILGDWSGRLLLTDSDIDDERGVIRGEMRQRSNPGNRILTALAPEIYQGNIYGYRMPIGKAEIIDNFKTDDLRDYYHKWYHPRNQAVIIVGDIDPDFMEQSIRRHFDGLAAGPQARIAAETSVDDNPLPIFVCGTDPEQASDMIQLYVKDLPLQAGEEGTIDEIRRDYIRTLVSNMLVERFDALENTPDCPWRNLGIGFGKFLLSGSREALMLRASSDSAPQARAALRAFRTELLRAALHGFTDTELQRARLSARADLNSRMANVANESNTVLGRRFVKHFIRGGALISTEQLYKMMAGVERTTTLDEVNRYFANLIAADGRNSVTSVYAAADDADSLTADIIRADAMALDTAAITPFVDGFAGRELMDSLPEPGQITAESAAPFGATMLTLSNGIRVYLRQSGEKPDEVMIHGISPGGFSMNYDPALKAVYKLCDEVVAASGFGGHSSSDLKKLLAGRNVKSLVKIGNTSEEITVVSSPADLTTAFQLLYLKATAINRDDNAFGAIMAAQRSKLSRPVQTATYAMGDTIHSIVYRRHPLGAKLNAADLESMDYDKVLDLYRDRFADMGDFTFVVTGNFSADSIRPLLETYLASLPSAGRKERARDTGYGFFSGEGKFSYTHPMTEQPQSISYSFFNGECPYDLQHILLAQAFGQILKSRLLADIREARGITYSINSHCSVTAGFNGPDTPSRFILPVYVKVAPGHEDECFEAVRSTVRSLCEEGPTAEELAKVTAYLSKNIAENRRDNAYWDTVLKVYDQFGPDMDSGYEELVAALTPEAVRDFGATFIKGADHVEISMLPE